MSQTEGREATASQLAAWADAVERQHAKMEAAGENETNSSDFNVLAVLIEWLREPGFRP